MHDETMTERATIDRAHLAQLHGRELATFRGGPPAIRAALAERPSAPAWRGADELDGEVAGEFPVFVERAEGASLHVRRRDRPHRSLPRRHRRDDGHFQPQPWTP